jgi:uroporphyrinogen decarboxylase
MVSTYLRGIDKMFMDLALNKSYSEMLLEKIGAFMLQFHKKNMSCIGDKIDLYGIWDDFADQDGLMISPDMWRKYYKPWDRLLIEEAKKYGLLVCFHVCGNCTDIIPDLIEMGVDILDPVQVSAKDMDLLNLKRRFGKHICLHGGLDAQKLLINRSPYEIKEEVKRINEIFAQSGGLILGPSHYFTSDIPLENILAIYS